MLIPLNLNRFLSQSLSPLAIELLQTYYPHGLRAEHLRHLKEVYSEHIIQFLDTSHYLQRLVNGDALDSVLTDIADFYQPHAVFSA